MSNSLWREGAERLKEMLERKNNLGSETAYQPQELFERAVEYFQWCEQNPLYETKAFHYQGQVTMRKMPKSRVFTMPGLCVFLGLSVETFSAYRNDHPKFADVIKFIDQTIYEQKFSGAAADLFNANFIARDLGLRDAQDHTTNGTAFHPPSEIRLVAPKNDSDS